MIRVGIGYDVHAFSEERPLILGGITIPHTHGLLGHSDADVLAHAITDALLGALALGSIGDWFPDSDEQFKNADSLKLLETIVSEVNQRGYTINNVDSVIIAQAPKLQPYMDDIQQSLAVALDCDASQVGVKATTTERLGFEGRNEGIAAQAVVSLFSFSMTGVN